MKRGIWQVRHSSAGDAVPSRCICIGLKDARLAGRRIANAVTDALDNPVAFFGRSDTGIPLDTGVERVHGLFIVLLPTRMRHVQAEVVEGVTSFMESEYVRERLLQAETPAMIIETLREGMQVALD